MLGGGASLFVATAIRAVDVEHVESICNGSLLLGQLRVSGDVARETPARLTAWKWDITLVREEFNFASSVFLTTHHAGAGEERVVDGVCAYVGVTVPELDIDDNKIVNMLHVDSDLGFHETFVGSGADKNVARGSIFDLITDVTVEVKLTICPFDFDLRWY